MTGIIWQGAIGALELLVLYKYTQIQFDQIDWSNCSIWSIRLIKLFNLSGDREGLYERIVFCLIRSVSMTERRMTGRHRRAGTVSTLYVH